MGFENRPGCKGIDKIGCVVVIDSSGSSSKYHQYLICLDILGNVSAYKLVISTTVV